MKMELNADGERKLWAAKLERMMLDAHGRLGGTGDKRDIRRAQDWMENSPEFRWCCEVIGCDPDAVYYRYKNGLIDLDVLGWTRLTWGDHDKSGKISERREKAAALFRGGMKRGSIASKLGVSRHVVSSDLRALGVIVA